MENIMQEVKEMKATIEELKSQLAIVPVSTVHEHHHHENNINISQQIIVYLNTECKDAMSIYDFASSLTINDQERFMLEHERYNTIVMDIWKRNYEALPVKQRPLYCVRTKANEESEGALKVFAKSDEEWKEPEEPKFHKEKDYTYATVAIEGACHRIHEFYREMSCPDDEVVDYLHPTKKGHLAKEWRVRKTKLWKDVCQLDAKLRGNETA